MSWVSHLSNLTSVKIISYFLKSPANVADVWNTLKPVATGKPAVVCIPVPGVTNPPGAGGTPPLGPQPAAQPCPPGAQPTQLPSQPFPVSQTTIDPGQTQAPGQVVHEVTTTEINPTHNVSTTEYWFGKANETLNRTNGKCFTWKFPSFLRIKPVVS